MEFARIEADVLKNPRSDLGDLTELKDSINREGLHVPLLVWHKRLSGDSDFKVGGERVFHRYILMGGWRRHAAISDLRTKDPGRWDKVAVTLFHGTETEVRVAMLTDNVLHEGLNPVDLANGCAALMADCKDDKGKPLTLDAVAKQVGLSRNWLGQLLKVREKACPAVLRSLAKGEITLSSAMDIIRVDEQERQGELLEKYRTTRITKGKKAAKRETKKATGKPVRVTEKDIRTLRDGITCLADLDYWKGVWDALRFVLGENKTLKTSALRAVDERRKTGGGQGK